MPWRPPTLAERGLEKPYQARSQDELTGQSERFPLLHRSIGVIVFVVYESQISHICPVDLLTALKRVQAGEYPERHHCERPRVGSGPGAGIANFGRYEAPGSEAVALFSLKLQIIAVN
jgi:hypothetical protein